MKQSAISRKKKRTKRILQATQGDKIVGVTTLLSGRVALVATEKYLYVMGEEEDLKQFSPMVVEG